MSLNARVTIAPPTDLDSYGPSALFRYFVEAGGWSYNEFADEVSQRHRCDVIGTDAVSDWANADVLPKKFRAALFRLIEDRVADEWGPAWKASFQTVWAVQRAMKKKRRRRTENVSMLQALLVFCDDPGALSQVLKGCRGRLLPIEIRLVETENDECA